MFERAVGAVLRKNLARPTNDALRYQGKEAAMTDVLLHTEVVVPKLWQDSYAQQRAEEIRLSNEENHVGDERFLLEPSYDGKDNLRINYVYPDTGAPIIYETSSSRYKRNVYRTRLKAPFVGEDGKTVKYLAEKNQPVYPYFSGLWRYFRKVDSIPTLVVTEGELKALAACKHGIPCVGIPGIFQFGKAIKNEAGKTVDANFHPLLLESTQAKGVKRIIYLHDADATDNADNLKRAASFWSSVWNIHFACRNAGLPLIYKIIGERANGKGIDDVLSANPDGTQAIREALLSTDAANDLFQVFPVEGWADLVKLRTVFSSDFSPSSNKVIYAEEFIQGNYSIRFNAFSGENELDGKPMTDRHYNGITLETTKWFYAELGKTMPRDISPATINSPATVAYNPFRKFIDANAGRPETSAIAELGGCIETDTGMVGAEAFFPQYTGTYLRKWLINMVALGLDGVNNPLLIALLGRQGTGKTEFFRRLLPEELSRYYAEHPISGDKDFLILLTKMLLVCDDELTGKTRAEQSVIKTVLSSQKYDVRAPYGRVAQSLQRRASLSGTGNDLKVLADPTGNRRIIPINVLGIDHARYNALDKTDLLIEAYRAYRSGEAFRLTGAEVEQLNEATSEFEANNVEFELIGDWLTVGGMPGTGNENMYSTTELLTLFEPITKQRLHPTHFGRAMTKAGFVGRRCRKNGGVMYRYIVAPDSRIFRTEQNSTFLIKGV